MCGIFGWVSTAAPDPRHIDALVRHSQQRGSDSSGLVLLDEGVYDAYRADFAITKLLKRVSQVAQSPVLVGHSRLVTNGTSDNQPVVRNGICVIHNGIIVNHESIWTDLRVRRELEIDTEVIAGITEDHLTAGGCVDDIGSAVLTQVKGIVATAILLPTQGKLILVSNNGSLYLGEYGDGHVFASERFGLSVIGAKNIRQVRDAVTLDIPESGSSVEVTSYPSRTVDLVPGLYLSSSEEMLLEYPQPDFERCTRCILPSTMPFLRFNDDGVCNYCLNYRPRNNPRPKEELFDLVEPYRRNDGPEVIVPFSGGRDSCQALHLIVNELGLRPVTYTYDWGMVTDLGRRNISRMSAELGVENIIVAADITKKREHIQRNLTAWLKSPHLGMLSILTAGDKHFFRHVESVKEQTGVGLNLWGVNPLEVTHFKAGFLGVPPDFEEERVYAHGAMKQLRYQGLRFKAMLQSPGYFNQSLWDTVSGEYYRSFREKSDYFHVFDYWRWDEQEIDETLESLYDWERSPDTRTTWRIGDGTAAFYNYVYYTVAGFTEHDTFRSNQVREGDLTREEALALVKDENTPRYPNLRWYLDVLGMEFAQTIQTVNAIPRLYDH